MTISPKDVIEEYTRKVFLRIEEVKTEKKISDKTILDGLQTCGVKVNRNTFNDWRNGKSSSFLDCIGYIAEILNIDFNELTDLSLLKTENLLNNKPTPLALQVLEYFDQCDEKGQCKIIAVVMEELARSEQERKKAQAGNAVSNAG